MNKIDEQIELKDKIVKGLELVYKRLIEFKKSKNSELVIMQNGKIVKINPSNISPDSTESAKKQSSGL